MADFSALITAKLDTSNLQTDLNTIGKNIKLPLSEFSIDAAGLQKALQDALNGCKFTINSNSFDSAMQKAGASAGDSFSRSFNSSIGSITSNNSSNTIKKLQDSLSKFKFDTSQIATITKSLDQMDIEVSKVTSNISKNGILKLNVSGIDEFGRAVTIVKSFDLATNELIGTSKTFSQSFDSSTAAAKQLEKTMESLQTKVNNGGLAAEISKIELSFSQLEKSSVQTEASIKLFRDAQVQLMDALNSGDTQQIAESYEKYNQALQSAKNNISMDVDANKQLAAAEKEAAAAQEELNEVKDRFSNGTFAAEVSKVETSFNSLKTVSQDTQNSFNEFESAYRDLQTAFNSGDVSQITSAYANYQNALISVRNQITVNTNANKELAAAEKEAANAQATLSKSATLSNNIQTWMNNNKKAAQEYGTELTNLQNQLKNNTDASALKEVSQRFNEIKSEASAAGLTTQSFASGLGKIALQVAGITNVAMAIRKVINVVKEGIQIVTDLDSAMAQLQIVTGATDTQMTSFLSESIDLAKELGQSVNDVIDSITVFSRLGYNLEDSSELAKYSSILSNVAGVDLEDATTGLTSVIKGFGMEVDQVEHVSDVLIEVGQSYAVSADEILRAMEKSSAALSATGTSLEESVAIVAAGKQYCLGDMETYFQRTHLTALVA